MDAVLYWNDVVLEANRQDHSTAGTPQEQTGPTMSARAAAIAHIAIYDGYFGATGGPPTYTGVTPAGSGSAAALNPQAAAAAAAHRALTGLYPAQAAFLDERLATFAAEFGVPPADHPASAEFGRRVGLAILRRRAFDPPANGRYTPSDAPLFHRPDPANPNQGYHGPAYAAAAPFAVRERFPLADFPRRGTAGYGDALRQVIAEGGAAGLPGTTRTAEQTEIGVYWAYDGVNGIGTPPRLYNQIVRAVAAGRKNTEADNARLFALVNVAMADAALLAWREKYRYELWRPVLGVREHGTAVPAGDGSAGLADPAWLPLGAPNSNSDRTPFTPPFPAYPSGHATFGAAAFQVTRLFYKQRDGLTFDIREADAIAFDFVSDELNGVTTDGAPNAGAVRPKVTRHFDSLWAAVAENGVSRVYLGVHWVFDAFVPGDARYEQMVGGVPLGLKVAEDIFAAGDLAPSAAAPPGPSTAA